jgi:hypothetical protein
MLPPALALLDTENMDAAAAVLRFGLIISDISFSSSSISIARN